MKIEDWHHNFLLKLGKILIIFLDVPENFVHMNLTIFNQPMDKIEPAACSYGIVDVHRYKLFR